MPSRATVRRAFVLALVVIGCGLTAQVHGEPALEPSWLLQVTFPSLPADADPEAYTGRVEVTVKGIFVGCAWAAWDRRSTDEIRLIPMALGYAVSGRQQDIRVEAFGELNRLGGMAVKITPLGGPVIGLQDPR